MRCLLRGAGVGGIVGGKKCCQCNREAAPGRASCEPCLSRSRSLHRDSARRKKASGLCLWGGCEEPPSLGHVYCSEHLAKLVLSTAKRRRVRIRKGLCVQCADPARPTNGPVTRCEVHVAKQAARATARNRERGVKPRVKMSPEEAARRYEERRPAARATVLALYHGRRRRGLCGRCGAPAVAEKTLCRQHLDYAARWMAEHPGKVRSGRA